MNGIILAAVIIGITGLAIGLLLGLAGKKFAVEVDERITKVRDLLPSNNCGGCGYAGCDAMAEAIVKGEAQITGCPSLPTDNVGKIAAIMGTEAGEAEKQVAFVKCKGTCDKSAIQYHYYGIADCKKLSLVPGNGEKVCREGCMGYGSCVKVCAFDAIHIVNGIAQVDKDKCVACGKCVAECPQHIIELVPYKAKHLVQCNSHEKGKNVKQACEAGCIGCGICAKQCEEDAIQLENNLAYINQDKCTGCGKCAEKCPVKVIL